MYNTPLRFDGDIIITDPSYIIKHEIIQDYSAYPCWWDFVSKATYKIYTDTNGKQFKSYTMPEPSDYPDCHNKTIDDYPDDEKYMFEVHQHLREDLKHSDIFNEEWKAYTEACEKWEHENINDWDRCDYGNNMELLGIHNYLSDSTCNGDWACITINSITKEKLGEFCADSGNVGVFLLDEVLSYNPNFDFHTKRPWTTTWIKDFHGTVKLYRDRDGVAVIGEGNISFIGAEKA